MVRNSHKMLTNAVVMLAFAVAGTAPSNSESATSNFRGCAPLTGGRGCASGKVCFAAVCWGLAEWVLWAVQRDVM